MQTRASSLAARIVAAIAKAVGRDRSREQALERIRKFRRPLPPGFRFDRDDANARYGNLHDHA